MQIDLPQDLVARVKQRMTNSHAASEADVIRKALDVLDWHDEELRAVQEGIDAWRAGNVQSFDAFDRAFRTQAGLPARD